MDSGITRGRVRTTATTTTTTTTAVESRKMAAIRGPLNQKEAYFFAGFLELNAATQYARSAKGVTFVVFTWKLEDFQTGRFLANLFNYN